MTRPPESNGRQRDSSNTPRACRCCPRVRYFGVGCASGKKDPGQIGNENLLNVPSVTCVLTRGELIICSHFLDCSWLELVPRLINRPAEMATLGSQRNISRRCKRSPKVYPASQIISLSLPSDFIPSFFPPHAFRER